MSEVKKLFATLDTSAMLAQRNLLPLMPNLALSALKVITVPKVRRQAISNHVPSDTTVATSVSLKALSVLSVARVKLVAHRPPFTPALTLAQVAKHALVTVLRPTLIPVSTLLRV